MRRVCAIFEVQPIPCFVSTKCCTLAMGPRSLPSTDFVCVCYIPTPVLPYVK